jgi:hypothetical protein
MFRVGWGGGVVSTSLLCRFFFMVTLPRQSGRQPGSQNKVTVILKNAILESFERLGGVSYLEAVGRSDPKAYLTLMSKIIPRTESKPETTVSTLSDAEIRSRVALMLREGLSAEAISTGESIEAEAVTVKRDA